QPTIRLATVWPHVLAGRFVDRLGTGIRSAPRDALIAGAVDQSRRGAAFGLEGVGDNLGAVLGPLLAAALLYVLVVPLRSMFFIAFIPGAIAFLLVLFVRETPRPAGARTGRLGLRALPHEYWRHPAAVRVFCTGYTRVRSARWARLWLSILLRTRFADRRWASSARSWDSPRSSRAASAVSCGIGQAQERPSHMVRRSRPSGRRCWPSSCPDSALNEVTLHRQCRSVPDDRTVFFSRPFSRTMRLPSRVMRRGGAAWIGLASRT